MAGIPRTNEVQEINTLDSGYISGGVPHENAAINIGTELTSGTNKVEISDDEKRIMMSLGYTLEQWVNLSENERNDKINNYITSHTPDETSGTGSSKPKITLKVPNNWKSLSLGDKQRFIFNEFGRAYVENWDTLSNEDKHQIIETQLAALCEKVDPQFQYMNAKDKEKAMEYAYITFGVILENADPETIGNGGLIQAYNALSRASKQQVHEQMSIVREELDLNLSEEVKLMIDDFNAVKEYFHQTDRPTDKQRLEYYRHLQQNGGLSEFQQREFDILVQKEQVDPSSMSYSHRDEEQEALTSIEEVFSTEGSPFIKNKDGLLKTRSNTNRERFISNFRTRFGNTSNLPDDDAQLKSYQAQIAEIYSGLSAHEKDFFLNTILRDGNIDRRLLDGINDTAGMVVAANDELVSCEARSEAIGRHTNSFAERRANGEKVETQGFYDYVNSDDNHFDDNNKSDLQYNVLKDLGKDESDKAMRSLKENCSNYLDILALSDNKVHNDNDISDDLKQFYAQNSIEIMDNDADRQARSDSLSSYNNDSFNRGVQQGYENIANGTASGSRNYSNNATNPITNNSNSQLLTPQVQQAYATFINNSQDGKPISHEQAVRIFQRLEPNEQRDFLTSLTPQQVSQIPITVCNSFPELINTFIDLGKGVDIIQQCNVNTGNRTIQLMAKSKGAAKKQFNEWAANHTDRLAKCTYDELVASGAIAVGHNRAFNVLKA